MGFYSTQFTRYRPVHLLIGKMARRLPHYISIQTGGYLYPASPRQISPQNIPDADAHVIPYHFQSAAIFENLAFQTKGPQYQFQWSMRSPIFGRHPSRPNREYFRTNLFYRETICPFLKRTAQIREDRRRVWLLNHLKDSLAMLSDVGLSKASFVIALTPYSVPVPFSETALMDVLQTVKRLRGRTPTIQFWAPPVDGEPPEIP